MRDAKCIRIGAGILQPVLARLDADGAIGRMGEQPFDADGACARADIPQQFAAAWRQRRQADRANLAFGQLPVMSE